MRLLPPTLLSIFIVACWGQAKTRFNSIEIAAQSSEVLICDLNGDGLKDLLLMDDFDLSIFYQDAKQGFPHEPQRSHRLDHRPCLIWTAKLGSKADSVLLMTTDGVSELLFTNQNGPPVIRQLIKQPTLVPDSADNAEPTHLPLSANTGRGFPLLLVPTAEGLQIWQHSGDWNQAQLIRQSVDARRWPSLENPGYDASFTLNFTVGDLNGDHRDDLIVRRNRFGTNIYSLYIQETNGLFAPQPALTYSDKIESHSWLCWVDLNHDGKVDLIRSRWPREPSFIPGHPSGKVLVSTYIADARGAIPSEPRQVFRKNDWTAALPIVDVDGDGFLDLALGYSPIDSREGVRKEILAKQLDFTLRFFFYRPGAGFATEADFQRDMIIRTDRMALLLGWGRRQYFERLVNISGDFNGDGKLDLLVRDQSDQISVCFFISRQKGFSAKPDLRFTCPEAIDEWEVKDLNNDGISDLIIKMEKQNRLRIFLSQK